jgi:hypothetical protein
MVSGIPLKHPPKYEYFRCGLEVFEKNTKNFSLFFVETLKLSNHNITVHTNSTKIQKYKIYNQAVHDVIEIVFFLMQVATNAGKSAFN